MRQANGRFADSASAMRCAKCGSSARNIHYWSENCLSRCIWCVTARRFEFVDPVLQSQMYSGWRVGLANPTIHVQCWSAHRTTKLSIPLSRSTGLNKLAPGELENPLRYIFVAAYTVTPWRLRSNCLPRVRCQINLRLQDFLQLLCWKLTAFCTVCTMIA